MGHTARTAALILVTLGFLWGFVTLARADATGRDFSSYTGLQASNPRRIADKTLPAVVPVISLADSQDKGAFGSGFFVRRDIVVTCFHVVKDAREVNIVLNGINITCSVVASDPDNDLALLRPNRAITPKSTLSLRPLTGNKIGDSVFAIGNPRGFSGTFTQGIISSLRRRESGSGTSYIQFTAPVSSGSSGGPLVDAKGDVIGVVTMTIREAQNLNFAVSANHLRTLLHTYESTLQVKTLARSSNGGTTTYYFYYNGQKVTFTLPKGADRKAVLAKGEAILKGLQATSRQTPSALSSTDTIQLDTSNMKDVFYVVRRMEIKTPADLAFHLKPDSSTPIIKSKRVLGFKEADIILKQNGFSGIPLPDGRIGWVNSDDVFSLDDRRYLRSIPRTKTTPGWAMENGYHEGLNTLIGALAKTPYVKKGISVINGIDAWNLITRFAEIAGADLPSDALLQADTGIIIEKSDLEPGDRLYFDVGQTGQVNHGGVYITNGYFIHASPSAGKVIISRISDKVFWSSFVIARRDLMSDVFSQNDPCDLFADER